MNIIEVRNLEKSFKSDFWKKPVSVLQGIQFDVAPGKITGFLGRNGAGKTTTIKCILGLILPDKGKLSYFGQDRLTAEVKARIGFLPERPYFYDYLTGEEFLRFYGELSGRISHFDLTKRIDGLLEKVGLSHAKTKSLRNYSKGMLQRIGIAQALIHRPEFVILDEPMSGLDPDGRMLVTSIIQDTAAQGTSVFFSSHLLHDAEMICENLIIVKAGQIAYSGTLDELLNRTQQGVRFSYFDGRAVQEERLENGEPLHEKLNWALRQNYEIREVVRLRPTLEQAFLEVSGGEA